MNLGNNRNQNHNQNNSNAPDVPPPNKKRKRSFQSYAEFLTIIAKLCKEYDSSLFVCLNWQSTGVICDICCADQALKGFFTTHNPCTDFNYSKFKKHCIKNGIHHKRITDASLKLIHPLSIVKASQSNSNTNNTVPMPLSTTPSHQPKPSILFIPQKVSQSQRSKFQKLMEIIGYTMSEQKLSEFFDSNCRQSVICWNCSIDTNTDSILKIHKLNRNSNAYKCNHTCADSKRVSWRKDLTSEIGIYYEHDQTFKTNMDRIREIYHSSTHTIMNANKKRKLRQTTENGHMSKQRKIMHSSVDIRLEKLELENIIQIHSKKQSEINDICAMNEWFEVMQCLEINHTNLHKMYGRIQRQIRNSVLLPVIGQIMQRYRTSMNALRVKWNVFESEWQTWNKEQMIYWIKNIGNKYFEQQKYVQFMDRIGKNELINSGKDMLEFNDLALLLLGLKSENDRKLIRQNMNRLISIANNNDDRQN